MKAGICALAASVALAGCGSFGGAALKEGGPGVMRAGAPSVAAAQALVRVGGPKSELAARLGPANVITFDSGWEVWVYRWPGAQRSTQAATELVVLVDPAGAVRKARVRSGQTAG